MGIKATEIEFSAKRRLNKFGSIKATPKASESWLVPMRAALVISRIRPRILEIRVKKERERPLARMFFFFVFVSTIPPQHNELAKKNQCC